MADWCGGGDEQQVSAARDPLKDRLLLVGLDLIQIGRGQDQNADAVISREIRRQTKGIENADGNGGASELGFQQYRIVDVAADADEDIVGARGAVWVGGRRRRMMNHFAGREFQGFGRFAGRKRSLQCGRAGR